MSTTAPAWGASSFHESEHGAIEALDPDTGEIRVSTPAIERGAEQIPLFEGKRFPQAEIGFGGKVALNLRAESDRALLERMKLGARVSVCVTVGEGREARDIYLDAEITARAFGLRGTDNIPTTTAKVTVDARKDEV